MTTSKVTNRQHAVLTTYELNFTEPRDTLVGMVTWLSVGRSRNHSSIRGSSKAFSLPHSVQTGTGVQWAFYSIRAGDLPARA